MLQERRRRGQRFARLKRSFRAFGPTSRSRAEARMATFRGRRRTGPQVIHPIVVPGFTRDVGFFGRFKPGGELKFHDIAVIDGVIAIAGSIDTPSLVEIPQGTGEIQRIGRKCTIRGINFRFQMNLNLLTDSAVPQGDTVRIIIYLDKQCNGATAVVTDILETASYDSFNNLANKSRFRTLMDRTYSLNVLAATGADATAEWYGETINDTFFKKVNIPIEYDSTTGGITEIRSNNISMLMISQYARTAFDGNFRLRFSDN